MNHPTLEQITRSPRVLVVREFTYEKVMERYRNILDSLLAGSDQRQQLVAIRYTETLIVKP